MKFFLRTTTIVAVLLASLVTPGAQAGLDPESDSFGVYGDPGGYSYTVSVPPFMPYHMYLIAANPTAPIDAFECVVTRAGSPTIVLSTNLGEGAVDLDETVEGYRVTRATPYPVQYGAVVLADWLWMQQTAYGMYVFVGPGTDPLLPGGLPVLGHGSVYRLGNIINGAVDLPVACVNGSFCFIADEATSFGALKSLYR